MINIFEVRELVNEKDWDSLEAHGYSPADLETEGFSEEVVEEYNRWIYLNIK